MITNLTRRSLCRLVLVPALLAGLFTAMGAGPTHAQGTINTRWDGVAIGGYDPVAYFTEGRAVFGSKEFAHEWLGATWRFASPEHRDLFAADPIKYAPQYGGNCANGLSNGEVAGTSPGGWRIVDGKLYMFASGYRAWEWEQDSATNIVMADTNWKKIIADLTQ